MRGKQAPKRKIALDPKYHSANIAKFINIIMYNGKKTVAQGIIYDAFDIINEKTKKDPVGIFEQAVKNVSPTIEVRGRRIGGANYQIPTLVRTERKQALAYRWLLDAANKKKGKPMKIKLAEELLAAYNKEGDAVKKKETVQKMAEANRAFAHFAQFSR